MDFEKVFNEMVNSLLTNLKSGGDDAVAYGSEALRAVKEKIQRLTQYRLMGELTEEEFISKMDDVRVILEDNKLVLVVIAKATLQKAVNSALSILYAAINKNLGVIK